MTNNCFNCGNCVYVLEGDYICKLEISEGAEVKKTMEEHLPTADFLWCDEKYWTEA